MSIASSSEDKNILASLQGKRFWLICRHTRPLYHWLLHVSELPSDRYRFNARNQTLDGKRRGNRFALGDKIEVTIGEIFELEGKISLYY